MLNNQSIPAPSNSGPVEMVSPPIDWAACVIPGGITMEGAFIAGLVLMIIPIIWSEYLTCKEFFKNEDL